MAVCKVQSTPAIGRKNRSAEPKTRVCCATMADDSERPRLTEEELNEIGFLPESSYTDEEKIRGDVLAAWLEDKWGHRACPYCDVEHWGVNPVPVAIPMLGDASGQTLALYVVICLNCGNTVFIPASMLHLWPEP